jgi:hypothetical protein
MMLAEDAQTLASASTGGALEIKAMSESTYCDDYFLLRRENIVTLNRAAVLE